MLVSSDIKFIRWDQKQRRNGKGCRASQTCFWLRLANFISTDTYMVFYLSSIVIRFSGIKSIKQMKSNAFFVQTCWCQECIISQWHHLTNRTLLSIPTLVCSHIYQGCHLSSTSKFPDFSLFFPWNFAVFHTLWQIKKNIFILLFNSAIAVSLKIWELLLKERILSFKSSPPNGEGDGLRLSHEKLHLFPSWTK